MKRFRSLKFLGQVLTKLMLVGVSLGAIAPTTAHSAEEIRLMVEGPLFFQVSVDSLEQFAETGELAPDLRRFAGFLDDATLASLQTNLQRPIPFNVTAVSNLTYSPLGRDGLQQVGEFIRIAPEINGFYGLRAALINAAANAEVEGWTILDVLREFPSHSIDVEVGELLGYWRSLQNYLEYNQAMVTAIQTRAEQEDIDQGVVDSASLPDLSQPGRYGVNTTALTVTNPAIRQTAEGLSVNYSYAVDVYIPDGLPQPAPIVMISHGFGALQENFVFMAEHLASHGFVVMIPDHLGSNLSYRQQYLQGNLTTLLSPIEFLNRPQEISFLIDELERLVVDDPEWAAILNLEQIGVMGDSFGAATVFSLSGAEINFDRLQNQCNQPNRLLNFSLYLQCRALFLPNTAYDLGDDRIQAAIAAHSLGYGFFGPEEVSAIDIPFMMVSGSDDIVAPVVPEQFYPFLWLQTEPRYLAMLTPGTHFSTKPEGADGVGGFPDFLIGENAEYGQAYYKTLTVAFFNAYLRGESEFLPYLTAAYADDRSADAPMTLDVIQSLTEADIEQAYGRSPFIPVDQATPDIAETPTQSVLQEIQATRTLVVGLRRDAPPFGFMDENDEWAGYCIDFVDNLRSHLTQELNLNVELAIVEIPSTLDNRFDLVRNGDVHLECGPNTIQPIPEVAFSQPILVAAIRFLVPPDRLDQVNPNQSLADTSIGVLANTTAEAFIETQYPDAEIVAFDGIDGRQRALEALSDGGITTFAGDDVLNLGGAYFLDLPIDGYQLVPERPLSCEFYGLILPDNDPTWRQMVNRMIGDRTQRDLEERWFIPFAGSAIRNLDDCINR